ncbi:hypothetical protein K3495_g6921 [Podosphaera aphanis]|nr:hypothetical protein K3495_g6921 [Podosphaera aphanis]
MTRTSRISRPQNHSIVIENNIDAKEIKPNKNSTPSSYLDTLKLPCENMEFSHHIKSLQPPEKFDGNCEMLHTWVLEMIDYFQNKEKDFGTSSNKGLVVFAKSWLDAKPANLVGQLILSGREFPSLFGLFEFLYQTYGIKDLYGYYERKFDDITWPSGSDQSQNLALFKAQIAPCKDVLCWSNRATISKFLLKLPIWTQRELTKLRFNKDDNNELLCELDDYFCQNYVSRQLLAASKRPQTSNLDAKSKNSSDSKNGHKNQADNSSTTSSKVKEKGSAQFNNQKFALKEELRELDRRVKRNGFG